MNLVDTESKPEAGHRFDVGVGREHPCAVRTHRGDGVGPRLIRCHARPATERLEVVLLDDDEIVVAFALDTLTAHHLDDADQPTTTFVGLSERVAGTPLSELDMLRPRHLSLASAALDRLHRLGFRHGDGHLGNFILGNDGTTIRIIDYEQAVRNASCARDGCADQIFLTKADVEHLRNGTSLSMNEAWTSAGAALGAKRGAHSSLRRFFLDAARKARTSHIT